MFVTRMRKRKRHGKVSIWWANPRATIRPPECCGHQVRSLAPTLRYHPYDWHRVFGLRCSVRQVAVLARVHLCHVLAHQFLVTVSSLASLVKVQCCTRQVLEVPHVLLQRLRRSHGRRLGFNRNLRLLHSRQVRRAVTMCRTTGCTGTRPASGELGR